MDDKLMEPTQIEKQKREIVRRAFWASFCGSILGRTLWTIFRFFWPT
jgi:hypothetical protein